VWGLPTSPPGLVEFPKYALVDDGGREIGYLISCLGTAAIPMPNHVPLLMAPTVMIGEKDHLRFEKWLKDDEEVRLTIRSQGRLLPGLTSQNAIGTLRARTPEEIIFCAHYDLAYRSPGANDNASGVEVLMRLAETMKDHRPKKTVRFVAFGAEEWGILGSHFYVERRKERGTPGAVKYCLDLDMVGVGDHLWLWAGPDAFRSALKGTLDASGWTERLGIEYDTPKNGSDHQYFYSEGVPSVVLIFLALRSIPPTPGHRGTVVRTTDRTDNRGSHGDHGLA
jgi:hypothetical protein